MISVASLIAAGVAPTQARVFADPLLAACMRFEINTARRVAAFVAQCSHESAAFTRLEEGLYYREPARIMAVYRSVRTVSQAELLARNPQGLANFVYAGRNGNGDVASGDGWRFRGRGLIQLTGRANYEAAGKGLGSDFLSAPEDVSHPGPAAMTAAWFWDRARCNTAADTEALDNITRAINGPAMLGASERRSLYRTMLAAFI